MDEILWAGMLTFASLSFGDRAEEISYIFAINNVNVAFQRTFLETYKTHIADEKLEEGIPYIP